MFKLGSLCREQVRWVVGDGNISFWHDSWVENSPLANMCSPGTALPAIKVKDLWEGNQWNEMELWLLEDEVGLPNEMVERILQVPFDRSMKGV